MPTSDPTDQAPPRGAMTVVGETIARPDPGLARGRWEAPGWVFVAVAAAGAASLLGGLTWLARSRRSGRSGR